MMYKLMTGKTEADKNFVQADKKHHKTRGHSMRLKKINAQKKVRSNHLLVRVVNNWNCLPEYVVNSRTTLSFKNRLDKVMGSKMIETDNN